MTCAECGSTQVRYVTVPAYQGASTGQVMAECHRGHRWPTGGVVTGGIRPLAPQDINRLPWSRPLRRRCRAVLDPGRTHYWGRCELVAHHDVDHALERGMVIVRWNTDPRLEPA